MLLLLLAADFAAARVKPDSLVLSRVFGYKENVDREVSGIASNVYMKHLYQTNRRNFTLWLIPHMYTIADGKRQFVSERYSRMHYYGLNEMEDDQQVYHTTIPRNRTTMSVLDDFSVPSLYHNTMYGDHILSPFCGENRRYYRYATSEVSNGLCRLEFRPRFQKNTQLLSGVATIEVATGRVIDAVYDGFYDQIKFHTLITQGQWPPRSLLPRYCQTDFDFKFLGNHITSSFTAVYDSPIRLADTVDVEGDRQLIDSIRPVSLSLEEQAVYDLYDAEHAPDTTAKAVIDTVPDSMEDSKHRHGNLLKTIFWDVIGYHLVRSHSMRTADYYVKLSPLLEPQYISYSNRRGVSYKMKATGEYYFNQNVKMLLHASWGYSWKQRQFYFNLPLRLTYAPKFDGYTMLTWANGNRIGSSTVTDEIRNEHGDLPELKDESLEEFKDNYLQLSNHLKPLKWLGIEAGIVHHWRKAMNQGLMARLGKPTEYRSLAPSFRLMLSPWKNGPLFTLNYERGINIPSKHSHIYLPYERWEGDVSMKHKMSSMQTLNVRVGGGLYTNREKNYFMDFANFSAEYLPGGWDDDWSGDFQLLSSRLYNASQYYVRSNISYDAPLLCASFIPFLGRYIERERFYLSSLLLEHSRLYSELGYSFSCQYFSMGLFASFNSTRYREFGTKFTFELFRRW